MEPAIVVIGLIAMIALALGLLCVLLFVVVRALWRRGFEERGPPSGGERAKRSTAMMPDPDGSTWWADFERAFAAHVAKQSSKRSGRRSGHGPG